MEARKRLLGAAARQKTDEDKQLCVRLPCGVSEPVLIVEGHEEPVDGEEHDNVSGHDEAACAGQDRFFSYWRSRQDNGQSEGRKDDSRGQKVAELFESRAGSASIITHTPGDDNWNRSQEVEGYHREWVPVIVLWQGAGQEQKE